MQSTFMIPVSCSVLYPHRMPIHCTVHNLDPNHFNVEKKSLCKIPANSDVTSVRGHKSGKAWVNGTNVPNFQGSDDF